MARARHEGVAPKPGSQHNARMDARRCRDGAVAALALALGGCDASSAGPSGANEAIAGGVSGTGGAGAAAAGAASNAAMPGSGEGGTLAGVGVGSGEAPVSSDALDGVKPYALDQENAERLWAASEELVRERFAFA